MKSFYIVADSIIGFTFSWTIQARDPSGAIEKMLERYEKGSEPCLARVYASEEDYLDRDSWLMVWVNKDKIDGIHIETNDPN